MTNWDRNHFWLSGRSFSHYKVEVIGSSAALSQVAATVAHTFEV
jgi:hypothetical protein